jgi:integrase
MTLGQFLDHWLSTVAKPSVSPGTYKGYEEQIRIHLKPALASVRLCRLNDLHVERLYSDMGAAGTSAIRRQKVGKTLRQALGHAVRKGLLPGNPATKIPLPKSEKKEIRVLEPAQVDLFLGAAEKDRLYALFVLAIDSGMRQGELFALRWSDINFEIGLISVQRSLENIGEMLRVKETKSRMGRRLIELAPFTVHVLHEHRKRMLAEGHAFAPVFCDTRGGYLRKSNFARDSFVPILKWAQGLAIQAANEKKEVAASLPPIRFHDLRHTCATILLLAGVNPKVVSERLGHSKVQITLDTYSHVLPTLQKQAAEKMNNLFQGLSLRAAQ